MTRIIAGQWRGRSLKVPDHGTRPTADRVREAIFSRLDHQLGGWGAIRVLDLYTGTGALGLEALSRGALQATLVDRDRTAVAAVRANIAALDADAIVIAADVARLSQRSPPGQPFDVVFADPPYDLPSQRLRQILDGLIAHRWIAPGATLVVETARRASQPPWPDSVGPVASRHYGETQVWYGLAGRPRYESSSEEE